MGLGVWYRREFLSKENILKTWVDSPPPINSRSFKHPIKTKVKEQLFKEMVNQHMLRACEV